MSRRFSKIKIAEFPAGALRNSGLVEGRTRNWLETEAKSLKTLPGRLIPNPVWRKPNVEEHGARVKCAS
ncbi:hypothetical protein [Microvirga thermotolerans]|uniref:Uncharacterized protein n=1 Tax=Microvirga thermotolerans TaxID=2651334 RepID=A0A5P9JTB0_9HYPH|nr:hypothetical protein [Microvirga thermotolerans]QFU15643.1 hypothetical protein GDR74_05115 [Microvirga thermotolerans]